jgi:hypothetical protein
MRPEEIAALGDLAGEASRGLTSTIRDTHAAISRRAFRAVGPAALPVQLVHDGLAGSVYGIIGSLSRATIRGGARVLGAVEPADARSLQERPGGRRALGALNGAFGDTLHRLNSPLELTMTVRQRGRDVGAETDSLAEAFSGASGRVAVYVHGLGQTEDAWDPAGPERVPYPARLRSELGYTPVMVRYNTGRSVDENGGELSQLLQQIVDAWPVPVHELALIGHATGALVCRSACYAGFERAWAGKVGHVITLGAPHRGSVLENAVQTASRALTSLPETRAAGRTLELRSAGLKDAGRGSETPFLPHVRHLFVSASIARDPDSRLGRALGDLIVSRNSAWAHPGDRRPMRFPVESYRQVGGINHFDLLDHPVVLGQIIDWLRRPELPPGPQRP